jgi:hypothetical protein
VNHAELQASISITTLIRPQLANSPLSTTFKANMSSTFSSPVTADGEQRQLLHVIQRCAGAVSGIKESGLRSALRAVRKATHRSPLLPVLGPAGIRQLEARLETALEDEENKSVEEWLEKCLTDIEIYTDAKEELDEAKARVEFSMSILGGRPKTSSFTRSCTTCTPHSFIFRANTKRYQKKREKAESAGQAFPIDYAA